MKDENPFKHVILFFKWLAPLSLLFLSSIGHSNPIAFSKEGMIVSEQRIASEVGMEILKAGGNAIDAAVAVGYALAVVYPCCGNIGGGGFMMIHLANHQNIFINFRENAPLKAHQTMYLDAQGELIPDATTRGYLAVAVPGTVLGLETALQKYGSLSRQKIMAPAIKLAREGYIVTPFDAKWFQRYASLFRKQSNVAAIFLLPNQMPYQAGQRLIQKDLANTLQHIAHEGSNVFYKGYIAKAIVNSSQQHGGLLSLTDFSQYRVHEISPIQCDYRGYHIISAPPPSSGGVTLCEMLMILEHFPLNQLGYRSTQSTREIIEAMRYGFMDRNTYLGDPRFVTNPIDRLLSKAYTTTLSKQIKNQHYHLLESTQTYHEHTDTTHYSIVDKKGNAVAVTYTLNGFFGAGVIAGHTGFFLNNIMDDFSTKPGSANKFGLVQSNANAIQPGKQPLSSMTPTIITKNGELFMVLGSPGGPRIITAVLLTILNVIDYGMTIQQAVNAPRFHYQANPDVIETEPFALPFLTEKNLTLMGYHFTPEEYWGAVEAIWVNPITHQLEGANDPRRPAGAAIGDEREPVIN